MNNMKDSYYFSPDAPIPSDKSYYEKANESRKKSLQFCTVWQQFKETEINHE